MEMKFAMFLIVVAANLLHLATSKKMSKFQLDDLIEDFAEISLDARNKCSPTINAAMGPVNGMTVGGHEGCKYVETCRPGRGGIEVCHTNCVCTNVG